MILALKPSVIYPAHGKVIDDPVKKIEFYISHRNQREKQILGVLESKPDESMSAMDIVKVVYTVNVSSFQSTSQSRLEFSRHFRRRPSTCTERRPPTCLTTSAN